MSTQDEEVPLPMVQPIAVCHTVGCSMLEVENPVTVPVINGTPGGVACYGCQQPVTDLREPAA